MRRIISAVFLIIIVNLCVHVGAIPAPSQYLYVNDFANVLNEETKNYVISQGKALEDATTAQIAVTTVESLEGRSVEDYALSMLREWGIGDKEKSNGILILLSTGDRKVKIEVGYGLEGAINDGKAGRILDEFGISYFKDGDWDTGIREVYASLLSEVYKEYGLEAPSEVSEVIRQKQSYDRNDIYLEIGVILFIFLLFWIFTKKGGGTPFIGGGGMFTGGSGNFGRGIGDRGFGGGFGGGSSGGGGASRGF